MTLPAGASVPPGVDSESVHIYRPRSAAAGGRSRSMEGDRPKTAARMRSSGPLRPDMLRDELAALEVELAEAEEATDYMRAHGLQIRIERLEEELSTHSSLEKKDSVDSLRSLQELKRNCLVRLQAKWDNIIQAFESHVKAASAEMKAAHVKAEVEHRKFLSAELAHHPIRPSLKITQLMQLEVALTRAQRYLEAARVKEEVEEAMAKLTATKRADAVAKLKKALRNYKEKNDRIRQLFDERVQRKRGNIIKLQDEEHSRALLLFKHARQQLKRASTLQAAHDVSASSQAALPIATAFRRAEAACTQATLILTDSSYSMECSPPHALPPAPFTRTGEEKRLLAASKKRRKKRRPKTAARRRKKVKKRASTAAARPSSAPAGRRSAWDETAASSASGATLAAPATEAEAAAAAAAAAEATPEAAAAADGEAAAKGKRVVKRRKKKAKKKKKKKRKVKRKAIIVDCDMCTEPCATVVSIPTDDRGSSVGSFCSIPCARKWNATHSPTQHRWIRDLLMDSLVVEVAS
eukprot:PLAT3662.10.p1 GENE.PLAT3662.10~~PLAT3662.10.p1  ORF type:complete len:524 (-),score=234.75 PLAT3662.10:115-1686(-)